MMDTDDFVTVYGDTSMTDEFDDPVSDDVVFISVERWTSGIINSLSTAYCS